MNRYTKCRLAIWNIGMDTLVNMSDTLANVAETLLVNKMKKLVNKMKNLMNKMEKLVNIPRLPIGILHSASHSYSVLS